jgi:hypothetical protein
LYILLIYLPLNTGVLFSIMTVCFVPGNVLKADFYW